MKEQQELKRIKDFEWASIAQYIIYISDAANLEDINSSDVVSFPLARLGPEKLIKSKERVYARLEGNIKKIQIFAGKFKDELGIDEIAVLRSMYSQYRKNITIVARHIGVATRYKANQEESFMEATFEVENDLSF